MARLLARAGSRRSVGSAIRRLRWVGGSIGVLAVVFQWNRGDTESFSRMVGSMGVAAVISANPLLLVVTVQFQQEAMMRRHPAVHRGDDVRAAGLQAPGGAIGQPLGIAFPGDERREDRPAAGAPGCR